LPGLISIKRRIKMSDNVSTNKGGTVTLDKDQEVPFTYPDGFNAVANSLQFLPEESRAQTLIGLAMKIVIN
jgi:hypothetical protein